MVVTFSVLRKVALHYSQALAVLAFFVWQMAAQVGQTSMEIFVAISKPGWCSHGRINIITGTVNAKLTLLPLPVVKPYITAGGGVANVSTTAIDLNFNGNPVRPYEVLQKQTVGTIKAGVGADFTLVGLTLFAEIQVNKIFFKEGSGSFVPIGTVGLTF